MPIIFAEKFENSVILYGSQTENVSKTLQPWFENSVILYGSQTIAH